MSNTTRPDAPGELRTKGRVKSAQLSAYQQQPLLSKVLHDGPTREQVLEQLRYEPDTGHFYWVKDNPQRQPRIGTRAGSLTGEYRHIHINRRRYKEHRLAWLVMTGEWPSTLVDHRNRDSSDNRWENLRLATPSQQVFNIKMRSDNTSGHRGVRWSARAKKWNAVIGIGGKKISLGHYDTKEAAAEAYLRAAANSPNAEFLGEVSR